MKQYATSPRLKKYIRILVNWFADKGFEVISGKREKSELYFDMWEVHINSSSSYEDQLHTMLHEAGHLLISRRKNYHRDYSHGYGSVHVEDSGKRNSLQRTDRNKSHTLDEEQEAWKTGLRLAHRLCIPIRYEAFERDRTEAFMTYIEWAYRNSRRGKRRAAGRFVKVRLLPMCPDKKVYF